MSHLFCSSMLSWQKTLTISWLTLPIIQSYKASVNYASTQPEDSYIFSVSVKSKISHTISHINFVKVLKNSLKYIFHSNKNNTFKAIFFIFIIWDFACFIVYFRNSNMFHRMTRECPYMTSTKLYGFMLSGSRDITISLLWNPPWAKWLSLLYKPCTKSGKVYILFCDNIGFRVNFGHTLNINWQVRSKQNKQL